MKNKIVFVLKLVYKAIPYVISALTGAGIVAASGCINPVKYSIFG